MKKISHTISYIVGYISLITAYLFKFIPSAEISDDNCMLNSIFWVLIAICWFIIASIEKDKE